MHEGNSIIGTARWAALIWLAAIVLFSTVLPYGAFAAQQAGGKAAAPASEEATQPKIHEFVTLLADPKIQQWLKEQDQAKATTGSPLDSAEMSMSHYLDGRLGAIREHIVALGCTIPDLPNQFWRGRARITEDLGENGRVKALLLLAIFLGLGIGVEWLFRKATQRIRGHLDTHPSGTVKDRFHLVGLRFACAVGLVAAFALGSVGPFLSLDWPSLLREMLFGYLVAFLILRSQMQSATSC